LATGVSHSVKELVNYVFTRLGLHWSEYVKQDDKFQRAEELHFLQGNASKAKEILGWEPTYTFETMLDEMIEYWMEIFKTKN
jgi:GDPmannose 4,6-dehydratase